MRVTRAAARVAQGAVVSPEHRPVTLRHATGEHVAVCREIAARAPWMWPRVSTGVTSDPNAFASTLWAGMRAVCVAVGEGERIVGVAGVARGLGTPGLGVSGACGQSGTACGVAELEVVPAPDVAPDSVELVGAVVAIVDLAFDRWPLRKVMFSAESYRSAMLDLCFPPLSTEGVLRENVFHAGSYWDTTWYACFREQWERFSEGRR